MLEYAGQRIKVTERLMIAFNTHEDSKECDGKEVYYRRVSYFDDADVPTPSTLSYAQLDPYLLLQAGKQIGIHFDFSALAGKAVGTTTGSGTTAQITLDTTAAGHGWYIDPTPLDNTDDYLPASNPNVWQAKAGATRMQRGL